MRLGRLVLTLVLVGALPASAAASTIIGKTRAETLRGTVRGDLIDAVGGGRDTVRCRGGIDTVMADASDRVGADCEVVARRIAVDTSQGPGAHGTIVEPGAAANGPNVVAVYQAGRRKEGTDALGFATSHDAGRTWRSGLLPLTSQAGGPWAVTSDPIVAWDARHGRWLASGLAFSDTAEALAVTTSSDGTHWSAPIPAAQEPLASADDVPFDKGWIACDNAAASPRRGTCYLAATVASDTPAAQLVVWATTDGGTTWHQGLALAHGYFAQLAVRTDGTLVVVYLDQTRRTLVAALTGDGGATVAASADVAFAATAPTENDLRAPGLPALASGRGGELELAWPACSDAFCRDSGILLSHSLDGGATWSTPRRLALGTGLHVIPALAADPATGRLVLATYRETSPGCCGLVAEIASSRDDGATWAVRRASVRPLEQDWLAPALGGSFVGDYTATVFAGATAVSVLPLAEPPVGSALREDLYAVRS
jgi:hypothetical protein